MDLESNLEHQTHHAESQLMLKKNKITRRASSFKDHDDARHVCTILAWVSRLDDYFHGEDFGEWDMVKCAASHLMGSAAI